MGRGKVVGLLLKRKEAKRNSCNEENRRVMTRAAERKTGDDGLPRTLVRHHGFGGLLRRTLRALPEPQPQAGGKV